MVKKISILSLGLFLTFSAVAQVKLKVSGYVQTQYQYVRPFIDYIFSTEGQQTVKEIGFITVK